MGGHCPGGAWAEAGPQKQSTDSRGWGRAEPVLPGLRPGALGCPGLGLRAPRLGGAEPAPAELHSSCTTMRASLGAGLGRAWSCSWHCRAHCLGLGAMGGPSLCPWGHRVRTSVLGRGAWGCAWGLSCAAQAAGQVQLWLFTPRSLLLPSLSRCLHGRGEVLRLPRSCHSNSVTEPWLWACLP